MALLMNHPAQFHQALRFIVDNSTAFPAIKYVELIAKSKALSLTGWLVIKGIISRDSRHERIWKVSIAQPTD